MHSVLAFCECIPVGYGREAAIMLWCFHTINHRRNQLSGVISTSTDTFTRMWYSPCGKVVKLKLSRAMNRSNYVSVITANPAHCYTTTGTSLQLAQISHPTARTLLLWVVWILSLLKESRNLDWIIFVWEYRVSHESMAKVPNPISHCQLILRPAFVL